jgi:hypothetical protein
MWLFPLPAIVALAGWILAFSNTGTQPIELGAGWLVAGIAVYLFAARAQRAWPFAAAVTAAIALAFIPGQARAAQPPFFLYGATFFYERVPRAQWPQALDRYKRMGINTIDLYVMWNWHEPQRGTVDFTGRTNPRRDLIGLLRLLHAGGFKIVLRPGPVIRNEWRNGGYPAWLLTRPEYDMPLRDVLEGRYPATATLQNAHSDTAAAEWMRNRTHMTYASRWLQRVFATVAPWRRDIVAVALDDDQGAYIDNDTWPGPHFHRYIDWLAAIVHRSPLGASMPVFINTYQMKVTASAPVWAWGNWYQSDAYSIGEHDRAQLEFSTGLLQTQAPERPVMISEFQAGWLQGADEPVPRPADPTNTTLALHTMLQMGAHGIVNFPVQDTLNPAGWEAPWTNAFYAWDAALSVQLSPQARWAPTADFGDLIARYGAQLAQTHPAADAGIAYLTSAYDETRITNANIAQIAQATITAQRGCRVMRITCELVDLRYITPSQLHALAVLIMPKSGVDLRFTGPVDRKLAAYRRSGGRIVTGPRFAKIARPHAGGIPNAVLLASEGGRFAFLDVVNYARTALHTLPARVYSGTFSAQIPALTVAPRDALLLPLGSALGRVRLRSHVPATLSDDKIPLRAGSFISATLARTTGVFQRDIYRDGYPAVVVQSKLVRLIVSPCAGARAFVFEDLARGENVFTTIGGLRDAWQHTLAPSPRDYIGKYTHPIATGTFNRCYSASLDHRRNAATFAYVAPDAPAHGAAFSKTIALDPDGAGFSERITATFAGSATQRAQQLTSVAIGAGTRIERQPNGMTFLEPARHRGLSIVWRPNDVLRAVIERHASDALVTLTFASGHARVRYAILRT